jgi:phage protein U
MAAEVLLTLGKYQFEMATAAHDSLQRSKSYRWASQQRLGREPASQFVGPGKETISLKGKIYPHFRGGLEQVGQMREEADKGEPLSLVNGRGINMGQWCIKSISDTEKQLIGPGLPRCIDFSLTLEAYGPDSDTATGNGDSGGGFDWLSYFA